MFFEPFFVVVVFHLSIYFQDVVRVKEFQIYLIDFFLESPQISTYISSWSDRRTLCIFKLL